MSYNTSILGSHSSYLSSTPSSYYSSYRKKSSYLLDSDHYSPPSTVSAYLYSPDNPTTSSSSPSRSLYEARRYISDTFGLRSAPTYDKYGKELSNYEKWKLQNGESISGLYASKDVETEWKKKCNRRYSRALLHRGEEEEADPRESRSKTVGPTTSYYTSGGFTEDVKPSSYCTPRSSITSSKVREKLSGYTVQDVRGDGGCYYRCLSLYFTGTESNYNNYRREVMSYIRENLDNYSSMIKSEIGYASTNDYFSRKTRTDRQEFAETTEIIATCVVYNINVHVLALVPGRRNRWEWLHFDPSIGSGKPSNTK
ncbi:unnamed protein product [Lepeophtheirus salmonis]|uniref:(salmon louse) hypothetical protein n=1 Tax=Lepeophtheirus salmonis TaxID=72036 RepID=A0A7R8H7V1_LEPSM|nr:unnamed protein product [Lepeophtheirus salmonis]CAF2929318.1 unnamed protein product [Lepeophtheirus salmonis]